MANNKLVFSEIFYHKNSAIRFELNTYKDSTKFKIEIIPALKDGNGNIILSSGGKSTFDYKNSFSMIFSDLELLKIKRSVENILNPQKAVPNDGYVIEHYFEVKNEQNNVDKKKSVFTLKRLENNYKPKLASPFEFKNAVGLTAYSSLKNSNSNIVLAEEEAYWLVTMIPLLILESIKENGRVNFENRQEKQNSSPTSSSPTPTGTKSNYSKEQEAPQSSSSVYDADDSLGDMDIPF